MDAFQTPTATEWNRLLNLLLNYMLESSRSLVPGADGMTVEDAVTGIYPSAALAGQVPSFAELSRRHADLAGPLTCFFAREATHHTTAC